jgi:tetratricopeptide (TPR) repeat protein
VRFCKRFEQALKEIETAQAIAPGTPMYERDRGRILYYGRRYDDAILQLTRTLELKSELVSARAWLWRSYEMKRDYSGAFETFIKGQKDPKRVEVFRTAYATQDWQGVKRKFLEFSNFDEQKRGGFYDIATLFAQLGEKEQAFAYLNKAIEERRWEIAMLNVDPQLDPLREDPRFIELLRRVGLR